MMGSTPDGRTFSAGKTVDYIADLKLLRSKLQMEFEKNESYVERKADNKKE